MNLKAEYWFIPGMKEDSRKMDIWTLPTGLAIYLIISTAVSVSELTCLLHKYHTGSLLLLRRGECSGFSHQSRVEV